MIDPNSLKTRISISDVGKEHLVALLQKAEPLGSSTAEYIKRVIEAGRMERRIIEGCSAILSLKIAYGVERLEAACKRGLAGTKFNYGAILNILQNKQDQLPQTHPSTPSISGGTNGNVEVTESLRGAEFFNIQNNDTDE